MPHQLKSIDHLEQAATAASYSASGAAVFLGLTVDEWGIVGVLVGIVLGAATFAFNVWFKMKHIRKD
jgi:hypothetical protein